MLEFPRFVVYFHIDYSIHNPDTLIKIIGRVNYVLLNKDDFGQTSFLNHKPVRVILNS